MLVVVAITFIKLFKISLLAWIGAGFLILSAIIIAVGFIRFRKIKKRIYFLEKKH